MIYLVQLIHPGNDRHPPSRLPGVSTLRVILASVNYSILLLCLAALDHYLAIARYEWYKKKVTNCGVIVLISNTSALTFVIITSPFWTGYLTLVHLHLLHQFGSHALGPGLEFVAGTRLPRSLLEDFLGIQNSDAPVQDQSPPLRVAHGQIPQHIQQKQRRFRYNYYRLFCIIQIVEMSNRDPGSQ
jgi:hypothetical protein